MLIVSASLWAEKRPDDALAVLLRADQLESSLLGEGGERSKLAPMFAVLAQSPNREEQFDRLVTNAVTSAGKAYGILGLYMVRPETGIERAKSLPTSFRVPYMLFCISGEWGREEFIEQLRNGNLERAVSYPVAK